MLSFKNYQNCTINEEFDFFEGIKKEKSFSWWISILNGPKMIMQKNQSGIKICKSFL